MSEHLHARRHMPSGVGRSFVMAMALAVCLALSGCGEMTPDTDTQGNTTMHSPEKTGTGIVRHDLAPLTKRFEILKHAVSATWMSGTLGGDAPGPTTYWIDAVVSLPPEQHAALAEGASAVDGTVFDGLSDAVGDAVPEGSILTSDALSAAFAGTEAQPMVVLIDDGTTLVLQARFE